MPRTSAREFGRLYTANTLGAIFGTVLSGFILIELVGLTATLAIGAACSLTAGIVALWMSRRTEEAPVGSKVEVVETIALEPLMVIAEEPLATPPSDRSRSSEPSPGRAIALAVAFVSGLTSLGYQVLWTRLLSSGSGNTTYIFTTILTIFLVGIAGGAALYTAGLGRGRNRLLALGITQVLVAAIAVFGLTVISGWLVKAPLTLTILAAVLPATIVMGLSLPIASGLAAQRDAKVASDTGLLLSVNTAGTVFGTFVVPFVLIPAIGSPRSVLVLAVLNAALGIGLLYQYRTATEPGRRARRRADRRRDDTDRRARRARRSRRQPRAAPALRERSQRL